MAEALPSSTSPTNREASRQKILGQHPVKAGQREEDVEHRVVGHPHFVLAFVEEVAQDRAVESNPQVGDGVLVDICRSLVVALVAEAFGDPLTDFADEIVD